MSGQEKDEFLKKKREAYHRKKAEATLVTAEQHQTSTSLPTASNKENMAPDDSIDCLRRSDMYLRQNIPLPYQVQESVMTNTETTNTPIQLPGTVNNYQMMLFRF